MDQRLTDTMAGASGHFWTAVDSILDLDIARAGYVRLRDNESFHIESLTTHLQTDRFESGSDELEIPTAIFAMTHIAGSVFFDFSGVSQNNVFGAARASIETSKARGIIVGISLDEIKSDRFTSVSVHIPGVTTWSGIRGADEEVVRGDNGRPTSWTATVRTKDPIVLERQGGMKLTLSSSWSVDGPPDHRIVNTPLSVGSESERPRPWFDHLVPLLAVQDLVNLAYQGFVAAEHGVGQLEYKTEYRPSSAPALWNSRLMVLPRGGERPKAMNEIPLFRLAHIGGIKGVGNWIKLDKSYPRATGPLVNMYRYGRRGVEVRLLEIALGIEYWTSVHRRLGRKWAEPRKISRKVTETLPNSLARHVGPSFAEFVGDIGAWSDRFWLTYNGLKHAPRFEYDVGEVDILGRSAAVLLECALLNRVSGSRAITGMICKSHRNHNLGMAVRGLLNQT